MGTINYKTSDYITLAIEPYDSADFMLDDGSIDYDDISECYSCDYDNAAYALAKYDFELFNVSIEPGYYEGVSIKIELSVCSFDDYTEKQKAQKEVTQIRQFLEYIAGCGYVACYPGWCTRYEDYNGTMEKIAEAVKAMRYDVKDTPTYYQTCVMKNYKAA